VRNIITPKYRKQKSTGGDRAFVELNGSRLYLGQWNTPESRAKYHRLLKEWESAGRQLISVQGDLTVIKLCEAFLRHAETYYRKPDGTPTGTH